MQKYISEFLGTFILLLSIVGSGIAGQLYTSDVMLILFSHALVIGFTQIFIIRIFAEYSGAHFNPFVSIAMTITGKLKKRLLPFYISAQILGCLLGVALANFFFEHQIFELSTKSRDGIYIFVSEIVATLGLIIIIFGSMKSGKITVAASVGLYITAGYWFTSSTSFANPAVAIARTFTESFTGISYLNTPFYIVAELIGMLIAVYLVKRIFLNK